GHSAGQRGAVVRGRAGPASRVRGLLLRAPSPRPISRPVRSRRATLVLCARFAARDVSLDTAVAGAGDFPDPANSFTAGARGASKGGRCDSPLLALRAPTGIPLLPAGLRLDRGLLLACGLQTVDIHPAGDAAAGPGTGLLPGCGAVARPSTCLGSVC